MSAHQDYTIPQPQPYVGPRGDDAKEDIRHIEEVPSDGGLDTKEGSTLPDHYAGYPTQERYNGRWGRLRSVLTA